MRWGEGEGDASIESHIVYFKVEYKIEDNSKCSLRIFPESFHNFFFIKDNATHSTAKTYFRPVRGDFSPLRVLLCTSRLVLLRIQQRIQIRDPRHPSIHFTLDRG